MRNDAFEEANTAPEEVIHADYEVKSSVNGLVGDFKRRFGYIGRSAH